MAQDISGTSLATAAAATHRTIAYKLHIGWGMSSPDVSVHWPTDWEAQTYDETNRLLGVSWSRQLDVDPLGVGRGPVAELSVTLANHDQRFSPFNTSSPLYTLLSKSATTADNTSVRYPMLYHVPIRLQMGFATTSTESTILSNTDDDNILVNDTDVLILSGATYPEYVTVFSGVIEDGAAETYGTSGVTFSIRALDRGATMLQKKASSTTRNGQRLDSWLNYLVANLGGVKKENDASFDEAFFIAPWLWLDDENLWSEAQAAAAADGGYLFVDERGYAQFRNAAWWVDSTYDSTSSQYTFTTATWQDLNPEYDWRTVGTGAIVEYQPRRQAGEMQIYSHNETITVPEEGYSFDARFSYPVYGNAYAPNGVILPVINTDWRVISSGGIDLHEEVTVTLTSIYAQRCRVTFTNTSGQTAFVPEFRLRGYALEGEPNLEVERNVTTPLIPYTKQARVSGNPYIQTKDQATMLATLAADRLRYPRLYYHLRGARAIPWLQLGDMITITASEPITTSRTAIITGLSFSYQPGSNFVMDVDCIDSAALYEYASYGYFVIGTSKYGGSSQASAGVVFL